MFSVGKMKIGSIAPYCESPLIPIWPVIFAVYRRRTEGRLGSGPNDPCLYYLKRFTAGDFKVEDLPWGTFGPEMVTYLAKKHNVAAQAQPPEVFYPVKWRDARSFLGPAEIVERAITPKTRAIHLYHGQLVNLVNAPPPQGSFLDVLCRRYGVDSDLEKI